MPRKVSIILVILCVLAVFTGLYGCHSENRGPSSPRVTEFEVEPSDVLMPERDEMIDDLVKSWMSKMTLEEKVAQLFIVRPESLSKEDVTTTPEGVVQGLELYHVSGIVYFSKNLETPDQTHFLLDEISKAYGSKYDMLVFQCVDEEGGTVARIAQDPDFGIENVSDARIIGNTQDIALAQEKALYIGGYLASLGFNVDFAPVADITSDEKDVMYERSFGSDPQLVSNMITSQIEGFAQAGVIACIKHFPGLGESDGGDSHDEIITTKRTLEEMMARNFVPFSQAIQEDAPMIMVGHIFCLSIDPNKPASLSRILISDILRKQLGYNGVIITDSQEMEGVASIYGNDEAAVLALESGADLVLQPRDFEAAYAAVLEAVNTGRLSQDRIDARVHRILTLKAEMMIPDR